MSSPRGQTPRDLPIIILTGFLGAGKTTLLNRVLGAQHRRRVAVLVNELGKIDIDAGLIRARAGDVLELSGGCVCHQLGVQRELWSALEDIVSRARPDVVVLETSGIAEPAEILRGLDEWQAARAGGQAIEGDGDGPAVRCSRVAAVVAVVDAEAGAGHLDRYPEARAQILCADRILLSKTELCGPGTIAHLHGALSRLNPAAERAAFPEGGEGTAALVPWLFEAARAEGPVDPGRSAARASGPHDRTHPHHQLVAATHVDDVPLVAEALRLVCQRFDGRVVRVKGWVNLAGETRRGFLERAGSRNELRFGELWGDTEARVTRLVLIGEALDEAAIRRQLWACRAGADAPPSPSPHGHQDLSHQA